MAANLWLGLVLTMAAGLLSGNCMLPMKFAKRWPWENTWLVFSIVSLVILPWALAFALVDHVGAVYSALPASEFVAPLAFGAGWGIAQVLFGLSIARLGMALGYAIIVGLGALLGTLVPLFVKNREVIGTSRGTLILSGVAIMVLGIAVSALAGNAREGSGERAAGGSYAAALAVAVLCGLMAPMLNYAFAFGQGIAEEAVRFGASPQAAGYAVWPIALLGGLIPNACYSCWLLSRNGTWMRFRGWQPEVWFGCLWAFSGWEHSPSMAWVPCTWAPSAPRRVDAIRNRDNGASAAVVADRQVLFAASGRRFFAVNQRVVPKRQKESQDRPLPHFVPQRQHPGRRWRVSPVARTPYYGHFSGF